MNNEEIKKRSDEMAATIFDFICEASSSEKDIEERCIELAASFFSATIDKDVPDVRDIFMEIDNKDKDLKKIVLGGIARYRATKENILLMKERKDDQRTT